MRSRADERDLSIILTLSILFSYLALLIRNYTLQRTIIRADDEEKAPAADFEKGAAPGANAFRSAEEDDEEAKEIPTKGESARPSIAKESFDKEKTVEDDITVAPTTASSGSLQGGS
jgi:hypothetical protein